MSDVEGDSILKVDIEDRNYNSTYYIKVLFWKGVSWSVQLRFAATNQSLVHTDWFPIFCLTTFRRTLVSESLSFVFSRSSCTFQHAILAWKGVSRCVQLRFVVG